MPELPALSISLAPRALVSPSFVLLAHRSSLNFGALWCSDSSNKSGLLVPTLFRGMEQHGGCSYAHGYLLEFDPNRLAMYVYIYIYVLREREREREPVQSFSSSGKGCSASFLGHGPRRPELEEKL